MEGITWPTTPQGNRSTTYTCKRVFATSIQSLDSKAAENVIKEKNWRFGYGSHLIAHVSLATMNAENALTIAKDGLEYLYSNFQFTRGGSSVPLKNAMQLLSNHKLRTATVRGKLSPPDKLTLKVPVNGQSLSGSNLIKEIERWFRAGVIEPSTGEVLRDIVENSSERLDLSGRHFVIMGAGAAMCPFRALLELGADIIAIDLDKPKVWKKLLKIAQESCGTITFPIRFDCQKNIEKLSIDELAEVAGCNLLTQTPEICDWLLNVFPTSQLTIGGYCYLDGEAHVRVSLAMDFIMKNTLENRPTTSIAVLLSPTDVFSVPEEAHAAANKMYKKLSLSSLWKAPIQILSRERYLAYHSVGADNLKDNHGSPIYLVNNIITQQGPNYILAKRLQQWRFILSEHSGCTISANVAPASLTESVMSNSLLAAGYGGAQNFPPMKIFDPNTANTIMAALLLYDINQKNDKSVVRHNPMDLFKKNAIHGGSWRLAYKLGSMNEVSAILYWIDQYHLKSLFTIATFGTLAGVMSKKIRPRL